MVASTGDTGHALAGNQAMMEGAVLPGNSTVAFRKQPVPQPGHGQVLLRMKASSICGSDIRAIYREHLGKGEEAALDIIAGHEPSGQVARLGPGVKRLKVGDRVAVYHISGCNACEDCRMGYMISCTTKEHRAGHGWQRDGGHAEFMLADEPTCILLPDELSYVDGALCACGFGTAWEILNRMKVGGGDRMLVTGLGPVGLATAMLARALGASKVIGTDISEARRELALKLELVDVALPADDSALSQIKQLTNGRGCEAAIDCSGVASARLLALRGTRQWGRCGFIGEGNDIHINVSPDLIHPQITIYGAWVTSLAHMEQLLEQLARWKLHPEKIVTHRFTLKETGEAYRLAAEGQCGKVVVVLD
ncbi:hypothetical protein WJX73_006440 [Symbiochloris irregularis]|uniref:Enoyl reductase (ER) domain-containing protein n=1 Tax=Symbiochloris irregularis TaxID=706552 RepID=A0AAW1NZN6_9CHLO